MNDRIAVLTATTMAGLITVSLLASIIAHLCGWRPA